MVELHDSDSEAEQEFDIINYDTVRNVNDHGLALMSSYISRF